MNSNPKSTGESSFPFSKSIASRGTKGITDPDISILNSIFTHNLTHQDVPLNRTLILFFRTRPVIQDIYWNPAVSPFYHNYLILIIISLTSVFGTLLVIVY
jgi:hypothetical protein